jgi:ribonuclease BN (tRNA processing enzyme)
MCQLYRVISLYAGADYLIEELFVKGKPINDKGKESAAGKTVDLNFAAHYFTHIHMEHQADIYQPPHVPGWFAVGSSAPLHLGYGFASDVHIDSVTYPHEGDENRFSWQLLPGKLAKCLHLFMRGEAEGFEARTGRYWYEFIYKPLKVEVYKEAFVSQLIREDSLLTV